MNPFVHSLHIGTLATWLSVGGFGSLGLLVHPSPPAPSAAPTDPPLQWTEPELLLGNPTPAAPPTAPAIPSATINDIPAPPELPESPDLPPLPELPEIPPAPRPSESSSPAEAPAPPPEAKPRPQRSSPSGKTNRSERPSRPSGAISDQSAAGGDSVAEQARLGAGFMPAPAYPAEARRLGQTGTLVVDFTVDSGGRVIAATVSSPSRWPLLNQEAVRTVRRWKFPPGPVMKLQKPIIFQLR